MRSLRILLSIHCPLDPNSGAAGAILAVANELRQQGHTVEVLSLDNLPRWVRRLPKSIWVRLAPLIFPWWLCIQVGRRAKRFDVIDMHSGDGWLLFWFLRATIRSSRRPLLATYSQGLEHAYYEDLKHLTPRFRWSLNPMKLLSSIYDTFYARYWNLSQVEISYRLADVRFLLNRMEEKLAVNSFAISPHTVRLTPNGLPPCLLGVPRPLSAEGGKIGIAQIGTFKAAKGYSQSIAAMTEIMTRDQRVFWKLLGTGHDDYEILAHFPPELKSRIQIVRYYERCQLPELLQGCEITVFPSLTEGFGMGLLEAMACHLAPVASSSAGPSDIITSPDEGILVPVGDAPALRDAIASLLDDSSMRDRI